MLYLLGFLAGATVFAYVCRLDHINIRTHRPAVVLVHVGGACMSALACGWCFLGDDTGVTALVLIGWAAALAWLVYSFGSYRHGTPDDAWRPSVLEERHHRHVVGGRR